MANLSFRHFLLNVPELFSPGALPKAHFVITFVPDCMSLEQIPTKRRNCYRTGERLTKILHVLGRTNILSQHTHIEILLLNYAELCNLPKCNQFYL